LKKLSANARTVDSLPSRVALDWPRTASTSRFLEYAASSTGSIDASGRSSCASALFSVRTMPCPLAEGEDAALTRAMRA
jgi:hypothetical protein